MTMVKTKQELARELLERWYAKENLRSVTINQTGNPLYHLVINAEEMMASGQKLGIDLDEMIYKQFIFSALYHDKQKSAFQQKVKDARMNIGPDPKAISKTFQVNIDSMIKYSIESINTYYSNKECKPMMAEYYQEFDKKGYSIDIETVE